ncbi:hypothetical protein BLD25_00080 [Candidatus Gracilibacteria bacterium GN02-872]|nr:hypothetical protein BLD25_00080 [Candidatus Gracilibacteria bacterium GN02-872]
MKKKIVIPIIVLVVAGGGYYVYKNYDSLFGGSVNMDTPQFGTNETTVQKRSFNSEIELTGNTKIKNEQKLKFNSSGKITDVKVSVGSNVKKGDVLVSIESTKAQSEVDKAVLDLDKAKRALDKTVEDLKDTKLRTAELDLKASKLTIEQKEKDLVFLKEKQSQELKTKENELEKANNDYVIEQAKLKKDLAISKFDNKNSGNTLSEKNISYEKQKRDYEDFKSNFESRVEKKINEYKIKLENTYYDLEKDVRDFERVLDDMGELIGARSSFPYINNYSAKNSLTVSKIKEYYYKAGPSFEKFREQYKKINSKEDTKNIIKTLEEGKEFYENIYQALTYVQQGFTDSLPTDGFNISERSAKFSGGLSRAGTMRTSIVSTIDDFKNYDSPEKVRKDLETELEKARVALETSELEIKKISDEKDFSSNTLDATQRKLVLGLEELKTSLEGKRIEFEKFKKSLNDAYREAEIAVEKEKINLKKLEEDIQKLKNYTKNDDYLSAKDAIKQAELNLENARKQLEDYVIQAPFDGVITKVDYQVGDRLTENSDKHISIVNPKMIEILVSINQTDIVKVKKDMAADITLDTYPDKPLKGTVTEIDTTPTIDENTGISKFSAKVLIGDYGDLQLYTGMRATVKLKVGNIPESLTVPFSAVNSEDDGRKYVTAIEGGKKVKKYVEVGYTDGKYYQILSGLKEGEKILEIDYDASKIKDDNPQFGGMGGAAGGMEGGAPSDGSMTAPSDGGMVAPM